MSLLSLPAELLLQIAELSRTQEPIYALARCCRRLHCLLRKYLLQHNVRYSKGSALIWAAKKDRRNLARRLLRLGADVNTRGEPLRNGTPLHYAAKAGHLGMTELLIKRGGDPEICGIQRYKPLLVALLAEHEEIAILLFSKMRGPNCEPAGDAGFTPLHAACFRKLLKSARVFLESGADVNVRTLGGETPLHLALGRQTSHEPDASTQYCTLDLVMLLLKYGSVRDMRANTLGRQHPDPLVREIFQEHERSSPHKLSYVSIGRRWWVDNPPEGAFSPTRTDRNHVLVSQGTVQDGRRYFFPENSDFPALEPSKSLQAQQPSMSLWDISKVEEIMKNMLVNGSTDAAVVAPSSTLMEEPFPKVIGRQSPHPVESVAQLSWRAMREAKTRGVIQESNTASQDEMPGSRSHVPQAQKKKKWRPLQLN